MLQDDPTPYRWQDHIITPWRAVVDLVATALIVLVVATAAVVGSRDPDIATSVAAATEHTPVHSREPPASRRPIPASLSGC